MMRLISLITVIGLARASHFMGGTISCEVDNLATRSVKCSWMQGWRLTAGPCGGGCSPSSQGSYGTNSQGNWNSGGTNWATVTYTVTAVNVAENWEQGSDSFSATYSSDGPHTILYTSCCWRSLNFGSGSTMTIGTTFFLASRSDTNAPNKPPQTMGNPIIRLQYQCPGVKQVIPMTDADLDHTQCRFGTAAECGSVSNILPHTSLSSRNGHCELTLDGNGPNFINGGWYAGCITIEDFPRAPMTAGSRSFSTSTPISAVPFQFMVYTPFIPVACNSTPTWVSPPTPLSGARLAAQVGQPLIITVEAEPDRISQAGVTDIIISGPPGGLSGALTSRGSRRRRVYTWTPTASQKGSHNICFQATDSMTKTSEYRCVVAAVNLNCPDPGSVSGTSRTPSSSATFTFGQNVSYTCTTLGHVVSSGNAVRTCQLNQQFSGSAPSCTLQNCGAPAQKTGVTQTGSVYTFGQTVTFSCALGYQYVSGSSNRSCQISGAWSGSDYTCTRIHCPPLTPHNNVTQNGASFRYLDDVHFSCHTGYVRDTGISSLRCQANRQWSGNPLICKRLTCPSLTPNANVTQVGTAFRYLDHVTWQCNSGYERASGDKHVQCRSHAQWNGTKLACKRITCPSLSAHNNATQSGFNFQFLDHVQWSCNAGYERDSGDAHVQCQANRQWNGTRLNCKRITCPPLSPSRNTTQQGQAFRYLDHVMWTCETGYERDTGDSHVQCQANRSWNGTALQCKRITCPTPTTHNNASRVGSTFRYLDHVSWSCNVGYEPDTGSASVQCQANRTWTGVPLTCKRNRCPSLSPHNNATQRGQAFRYLDHVAWKCHYGYERLAGDYLVTCQANRAWNGTVLSCKRVTCPSPRFDSFVDARPVVSVQLRYLDIAYYNCKPGYRVVSGDKIRMCQGNSTLNGTELKCADINECISHPCQNGAQCNNLVNSYSCSCVNGYTGFNCQTAPARPTLPGSLGSLGSIPSSLINSLPGSIPASAISALAGGAGSAAVSVLSSAWVILLMMAAVKLA